MTAELSYQGASKSNVPPGPLAAQEILGNRAVSALVHISGTTIQIDTDGDLAVDRKGKVPRGGTGIAQTLARGRMALQVTDGKESIK